MFNRKSTCKRSIENKVAKYHNFSKNQNRSKRSSGRSHSAGTDENVGRILKLFGKQRKSDCDKMDLVYLHVHLGALLVMELK